MLNCLINQGSRRLFADCIPKAKQEGCWNAFRYCSHYFAWHKAEIMKYYSYENNRNAIWGNRTVAAKAAGKCKDWQSDIRAGYPLRNVERLQMAWFAGRIWKLAYHLCQNAKMERKRRIAKAVWSIAISWHHPNQRANHPYGQHVRQGAPRRDRRAKKKGEQSIGRSRGGNTTKIHVVTASDREVTCFLLSAGTKHDAPCGQGLIQSARILERSEYCAMGTGYEGDGMRVAIVSLGLIPVVPPKSNRRVK